jgi:hypothetical protein
LHIDRFVCRRHQAGANLISIHATERRSRHNLTGGRRRRFTGCSRIPVVGNQGVRQRY